MFKKLLTLMPVAALVTAPALAQVSYGDRSGYETPRTERPQPPPRETLAPRSVETPRAPASQPATQTSTSGTVLEFPAETEDGQVIYYESTEVVPAQPRVSDADLPRQGTSQADVRARYGNPVRSFPAVGNPPITRWDYQNFRVFFEYNLVLHAVIPGAFPPISNRDELISGR